ncbi:MAG: hypothetical protein H6597_06105 [Flavobacteriales bacterium]|nr:hypothetical protein [Flavobacteriales bacterium]
MDKGGTEGGFWNNTTIRIPSTKTIKVKNTDGPGHQATVGL